MRTICAGKLFPDEYLACGICKEEYVVNLMGHLEKHHLSGSLKKLYHQNQECRYWHVLDKQRVIR